MDLAPSQPAYPTLTGPRYRSLDIWRGIACLFVVIFHASVWANVSQAGSQRLLHPLAAWLLASFDRLQVGVPMFFVISGYCIAATCDASRRKKGGITLDYFKRRLRRIFPPYWATVALTLLVGFFVILMYHPAFLTMPRERIPAPNSLTLSQWLGNLTLTESWRPNLFGPIKNMWFSPAWTLCYEEQFYVVCGLLLIVPRQFFRGTIIVSALTILTTTASALYPRFEISGFFFDGYWLMFAAGLWVYHQLNYKTPANKTAAIFSVTAGLLIVAFVRYVLLRHSPDDRLRYELYNLLLAGTFAIALVLLRPFDQKLSAAPLLQPLNFCGKMCYSLYLIHWPVTILVGHLLHVLGVRGFLPVLFITIPAVTLLSVAAASVFYYLVERHFLNSGAPANAARPRPANQTELLAAA